MHKLLKLIADIRHYPDLNYDRRHLFWKEVHAYLFPFLSSTTTPSPVLDDMCRENKLGAKTGRGFHDWPEAKRRGFVRQRDETLLKILSMRRPDEKEGR